MAEQPDLDTGLIEELPTHTVTGGPLLGLHEAFVAVPPLDETRRNRAKQPLMLAAAALMVVAGVLVAAAVRSAPVAADVRVERDGETVTVSLSGDVSVGELRRALDGAGVDVEIESRTTGPSRVGLFVGITTPTGTGLEGGDEVAAPTASFKEGDDVVLSLGVVPRGDAPYDVQTEPTAKGEPLAGFDLEGTPLGRVLTEAEGVGLDVEVRGQDARPIGVQNLDAEVLGGFMVSSADLLLLIE